MLPGNSANRKNRFRESPRTSGITGISTQLEGCVIRDSSSERTGCELKSLSPNTLTLDEKVSQIQQAGDTSMNKNSNYAQEMPQEYIQRVYAPMADQPLVFEQRNYHNQGPFQPPMRRSVPPHGQGYVNVFPSVVSTSPLTVRQAQLQCFGNGPVGWGYQVPLAPSSMPICVPTMVNFVEFQENSSDLQSDWSDRSMSLPVFEDSSSSHYTSLVHQAPGSISPRPQVTNIKPSVMETLYENQTLPGDIGVNLISNKRSVPVSSVQQRTISTTTPISNASRNTSTNVHAVPANDQMPVISTDQVEKEENAVEAREVEDLWVGNCNYVEYAHGRSNLFISWSDSISKLREKLEQQKLEVVFLRQTSDPNVYNVLFGSHSVARFAFNTQKEIQVRMVPPKFSRRTWCRKPCPSFKVKYEAKISLVVRKGKAMSSAVMGELRKGCFIWADQLKGRRIRVAGVVGSFKLPNGRFVNMNEDPSVNDKPFGWVSYRDKYTRKLFVTRRSSNLLSDYIYRG